MSCTSAGGEGGLRGFLGLFRSLGPTRGARTRRMRRFGVRRAAGGLLPAQLGHSAQRGETDELSARLPALISSPFLLSSRYNLG